MKNVRIILVCFAVILVAFITAFITGCASGGPGGGGGGGNNILRFTLKVPDDAGIDTTGQGYYAILFNSRAEAIEVTNYETFTDFLRYDGANFTWYHRQGNVPSPGYTWAAAGNLNSTSVIGSDGTSLIIRIDLNDQTNIFNQFITTSAFTTHVVTADRTNTLLGRVLDTLGQGPSIGGNTLYTIRYDKITGLGTPPPPNYPFDALGDWVTHPDLASFPYNSYDIESFSIEQE